MVKHGQKWFNIIYEEWSPVVSTARIEKKIATKKTSIQQARSHQSPTPVGSLMQKALSAPLSPQRGSLGMFACVRVSMYVCVCVYVCVHVRNLIDAEGLVCPTVSAAREPGHVCMCAREYICMYVCVCMYVCMYAI